MKLSKSILTAITLATALTAGAETWSLDSCISYAIAHNLTVKSRQISAEQGELGVTEAKDRFLPQVQQEPTNRGDSDARLQQRTPTRAVTRPISAGTWG